MTTDPTASSEGPYRPATARTPGAEHTPGQDALSEQVRSLAPAEAVVVPVLQERLDIHTERHTEGTVRVRKQLHAHTETVELPGWTERTHVQRVAIDQPADAVQAPRQEGDVWVVPVYEERWVTVKQLYLSEELHITLVREPQARQERVTLQREQVLVERLDPATGLWRPEPEGSATQGGPPAPIHAAPGAPHDSPLPG